MNEFWNQRGKRVFSVILALVFISNSTWPVGTSKANDISDKVIYASPIGPEYIAEKETIVEEETTNDYVEEPEEVETETVETPEVEDIPMEPVGKPMPIMSQKDIELIALVMLAEAEGECELGQRLVIDVILNRMDSPKYPDNAHDVIYQPGQFTSMWGTRVDRVTVTDEAINLVEEELASRTNYEVLYFRTKHYHKFGTPLFQVGNHYFSTY